MTGITTTLVWMAAQPPDAEQSRALASWSRAHGVVLSLPRDDGSATLAVDGHVADPVEDLLDRAREALSARDADATDAALSTAESLLRAHPELPQAAWLMAEVERAREARFRRVAPIDVEAAALASGRADALDGGRVAAVGEEKASHSGAPVSIALPIELETTPHGSLWSLWVDGVSVPIGSPTARPGPHAMIAAWDGAPVWAAWVETGGTNASVRMDTAGPAPCSTGDVARAHVADSAAELSIEAGGVRCPRWVAALAVPPDKPFADGAVRVASCAEGHCGLAMPWRAPAPWTWAPPLEGERSASARSQGWSIGVTTTVVGAAVLLAAGVALAAVSALQPAPAATRFASGGIKTQ